MEFVRRHSFLLGLVAGTAVVVLGVGLFFQFGYRAKSGSLIERIERAKRQAEDLRRGKIYTENAVAEMAARVQLVQGRRQAILAQIAAMGAARTPLVPDLFPESPQIDPRHMFKAVYRAKLQEFMSFLNAFNPTAPAEETPQQTEARERAMAKATLFAHLDLSFVRPDWLDKAEAPGFEECRTAQEDYWLMEDLVRVIARLNAECVQGGAASVKTAAVKELVEVRIGAQHAALKGVAMATQGGRYLVRKSGTGAAETPTGRFSDEGFYLVLPWRLVVVARSDWSGELVRRLKGTESFLTVLALRVVPITKKSQESYPGLLARSREAYGQGGVVLMEIVGESLVFQLKGGRVTTPRGAARDQSDAPVGDVKPRPATAKKG
jgi:hypothetical protein